VPAASSQDGPTADLDVAARRVVGYVRVSTDEQGASGLGLEAQRDAITRECERRGWQLTRIEMDVAGGARLDRPGLNAAIEAVAHGDVAGLVVSKLDRLSRSVADFSALLERFRSKGWGLVILDLGIDTTTVMGEAMATMAATFAQVERRRIGERTREALAVRKAQGVQLGRRSGVTPNIVRRIRRQRASGGTLAAIAAKLNADAVPTAQGGREWYPATVRYVLARNAA
jgi:DNA invertase Pin-like site-specific DNA recombinase